MRKIYILSAILVLSGCTFFTAPQKPSDAVNNPDTLEPKPVSKTLNLSGLGLKAVPNSVFSNTSIQELDLSNNNLGGAIPAEIRQLSNLEVLNLSNNQMTGVPAEVGQLSKLRVLNLSNNQLTGLPHELANLSNLKTLDLRGNNPSEFDLSIIKASLTNTNILL